MKPRLEEPWIFMIDQDNPKRDQDDNPFGSAKRKELKIPEGSFPITIFSLILFLFQ